MNIIDLQTYDSSRLTILNRLSFEVFKVMSVSMYHFVCSRRGVSADSCLWRMSRVLPWW